MNHHRYHRQIILPDIGTAGQRALSLARVLIVGIGGLGCPVTTYLTGAGIGTIGLVDHDNIASSNLHRQVLFQYYQIGMNKASAAQDNLLALNPDIEIHAHCEQLTSNNVTALFGNYDIIVDATDNFQTKFLINDAAVKLGKPIISGSVLQFGGQVSVFDNSADSPCYRCLYPEIINPPMRCADAGVLGSVAGMIGTVQANEVVKLIVGMTRLTGHIWDVDTRTMHSRCLAIPKNANCAICAIDRDEIDLTIHAKEENDMIDEKTPDALRQMDNVHFIDVREQDEWDEGHIDNAVLHPLSSIMNGNFPDIPENKTVVIYCRSGQRSMNAALIMTAQGHTGLINMAGGIMAWNEE